MRKSFVQFTIIIPLAMLICISLSCQKQSKNLTEEEKRNLVCFIDSIHLRNKAMTLLHEIPSDSFEEAFTPENIKEIEKALGMMKKSIEESQKVSDQTLEKLYPDLSGHYRVEFCEGLKLYIKFLEEGEVLLEEKSKHLEEKWGKWFFKKFDVMSKRCKWFLGEFAKRQDEILFPD